MNKPKAKTRSDLLINLSYGLFCCLFLVFWPLANLPLKLQIRFGGSIGRLFLRYSQRSRSIAETNLRLCFPQLNEQERYDLLVKNFESLGIGVIEGLMAWFASERKLRSLLQVQGEENLKHALQQNKGIIFLDGHFTTLAIAGRLCVKLAPFAVMYRKQKHPLLNKIFVRNYEKFYVKAIAREDVRGMVTCLKQKINVWYTPDVDAGPKMSVFAPFFGVPAATLTAVSRMAKMAEAIVVPVSHYRREDGSGYDLIIHPMLSDFPSEDLIADATRINASIEAAIAKYPEQYIWQYKRFKTRPLGEDDVYPKRR